MPRFHLNVVGEGDAFHDEPGVELQGLADAHWHALTLIARLMSRAPDQDWSAWTVQVADAQGRTALSIGFPDRERPITKAMVLRRLDAVSRPSGDMASSSGARACCP